ncbi:MAG: TFIIB-type zinc ribbon-containing protein [Thermoproteus sp. AZ2]|jgi:transcription initiation factor TFIIB|uniref:TFIIB-type zinc ribbon-containing protein n=1 Tax=Thermoproteus sp. AZ2 TaxID=1609232 RepID=A0ACC6V094_9CREN
MTRKLIVGLSEQDYVCPVCGSNKVKIDEEQGIVVCTVCGTVIRDAIVDLGPEWRRPESSRASAAPGTELGDIEHGNIRLADKLRALKLKRAAKPISTAAERLEIDMREFYDSIKDLLGIPKALIDEAMALYKKAYEAGYKASRREGYAAALYFAVKKHGVAAVTYKSLLEKAGLERGAFMSAYMEFLRYMNKLGEKLPKVDPKIYVPRIVSALGLSDEASAKVQRVAVDLLRYISSIPRIRNGRKPQVLAAAAVYYACYINGIEVTQKDLARAAESTETPIRDLLGDLASAVEVELYI